MKGNTLVLKRPSIPHSLVPGCAAVFFRFVFDAKVVKVAGERPGSMHMIVIAIVHYPVPSTKLPVTTGYRGWQIVQYLPSINDTNSCSPAL
jgi:hypothetical protein